MPRTPGSDGRRPQGFRGPARDRAPFGMYGGDAPRGRSARGQRRGAQSGDLLHSDLASEPVSRRAVMMGLLCLGSLAGVAKLADYQIFNVAEYQRRANARRLMATTIFAKRGTMYDRNGNVLTSSTECSNVYANPKQVKDPKKTAALLARALGVDEAATYEKLASDRVFVYIKRQADQEDADAVDEKQIAGIGLEPTTKRVYPYDAMASQVLGYVNVDNEGANGLEHEYDKELSGTNGSIVRERARDGSFIAGGAYKKVAAKDGEDVVLTIDADIQRAAEEAIAQAVQDSGATTGSAIVSDPTTGEILAACSYPTYNQQDRSNVDIASMNLRAVTDAYEPGSVFKTIVCGMGIDLGLVTPDSTFQVPAKVKVGDDMVSDADKRAGAMPMTLREIIRRSSNTGMVLVGEKIGADRFASYLEKFGIGERTGVDFPGETKGIVKSRDQYDGASLGAMSFGQALAVAPVDILRAVGAIANGGVMHTPHFLKSKGGEEVDWSAGTKRVISKDAAEQVVSMMETVVAEGTGKGAAIDGYAVAGKTGTAQRASAGGSGYQEDNYMSSFIGFLNPGAPQAMVYITLDGTSQSSNACLPAFKTIMQRCIDVLGIKPS